ncbi:MAG TPA: flagellar protein FlgN [Solimonas sp.]|nr:flagellar protein FlgN [Solimonas sp.]
MNNPWSPQANPPLQENLRQQLECTRQLLQLLETEKDALLRNDAEALEQVTPRKAATAELLRKLGEPLLRLGAAQPGALHAHLAKQPEAARLLADWSELREQAGRCQRANQENAALLETRHRQVRQTLQNMRGEQPQQTYGRGGYGLPVLGSQRLGAA